jgi:TetR/AcrR family transcriptional regulator, mexJK operon transcriptional repressor
MNATRERLVKHARELFREKGFKEASIGQLIARAGGSKETVYRHFKSKEDILSAVFAAEHEHYSSVLESLRNDHADVKQGLIDLASGMLVELTSDRSVAVRRMMTAEVRGYPDIGRLYYSEFSSKGYEFIESFVKRYQTSGDLKPLDSTHLTEYFAAIVLYRSMVMRECCVIRPMNPAAARRAATLLVGDFLAAFGT